MKKSPTYLLMGLIAVFALGGCATGKQQNFNEFLSKCPPQPRQFSVKVLISNGQPMVKPDTVVACPSDDIIFKSVGKPLDFKIEFDRVSPFKGNLSARKGVAKGKVTVRPDSDLAGFKYNVVVPGYPDLDPLIIIKRR